MSKWEENSILIERYLDGHLLPQEKTGFEKMMAEDAKLASELEFQKQLRTDISNAVSGSSLKNQMNEWHETYFSYNKKGGKVVGFKKRSLFSITAVAATISLLITAGSIALYHYGVEKKRLKSDYETTDRRPDKKPDNHRAASAATNEGKNSDADRSPILEEVPLRAATAFAITKDGWVITSYHTVNSKKSVTIEMVGDSLVAYDAEVRFYNKKLDIAFVKITDKNFNGFGNLPYTFSSQEAILAENVFTLGYPKDDIVFTQGAIASLSGFNMDTLAYQAGISINKGNSGGPLFNQNGEIVGIISGKHAREDGTAYAVKAIYFIKVLQHIKADEDEEPITLPSRNILKGKKITDQVKQISPFVFIIRA